MTGDLTRRRFVGSALAAGGGVLGAAALGATSASAASAPGSQVPPAASSDDPSAPETSTFFATARIEYAGSVDTASDGDLWPNCWADDGAVYAANGDGRGFDADADFADIVVNRIDGDPVSGLTGTRLAAGAAVGPVWGDPAKYNRKPTGMTCVDGVLYLAVQDLRYGGDEAFNDAPAASIARSVDHGRTWTHTDRPMFDGGRFTTVFFLDFGRDGEHGCDVLSGRDAGYVYAYGLDGNWRDSYTDQVPDPTALFLGRVPRADVQRRDRWTFFAGLDRAGRPSWSADITRKAPVLADGRRLYLSMRASATAAHGLSVVSQGGVVYNRPLRRYLYTSWTEYTYEFYEAPAPWGPWRLFLHHDAGGYPWFGEGATQQPPKNGGYGATIPSRYISADGRSMWVQSNWFVGNGGGRNTYHFALRRLHVEPATGRRAPAVAAGTNLARLPGTVGIEKSAHYGHDAYYNDGDRTRSEDSFDLENKPLDWWGYTWPAEHQVGRLIYTTGAMYPDGGWFSGYAGGLRVQVRRGGRWHEVPSSLDPAYPYSAAAGPFRTFTLRFAPTRGDGVRIIGEPGGASWFTSIAELEVYGR